MIIIRLMQIVTSSTHRTLGIIYYGMVLRVINRSIILLVVRKKHMEIIH